MAFVIIIGASGIGKSTLINRCLSEHWLNDWRIVVPTKHTTRPARSGEAAEYSSITEGEFQRNVNDGIYVLDYVLFGFRYGIPALPFSSGPTSRSTYVQTFPTDISKKLIEALGSSWKIKVLLLEADGDVVRGRLSQRLDNHTQRTIMQRLATANRDRHSLADVVLSADATHDEVFLSFSAWLTNTFIIGSGDTPIPTG
jgi:ribose 1,5-bisphosphokinase PhnN